MPDARQITYLPCLRSHARGPGDGANEAIAQLATSQHGVVARGQLLDLGITSRQVHHRLVTGALRRILPGIYAVGHDAVGFRGRALAALLAAGAPAHGIAVSHLTVVVLRGLREENSGAIHVTAGDARARRRGIVFHRAALLSCEVEVVEGIPATNVARTLLDLSAIVTPRALRRFMKRAEFKGLITAGEIEEVLARHPRRRGRAALAALVADGTAAAGRTRSDLEDDFLAFCRRHRLSRPDTNVSLEIAGHRIEIDCVWREERLGVELDGWQAHRGRISFEDDRARDRALAVAGWTVIRVTDRQLRRDESRLAAELRTLLGCQ